MRGALCLQHQRVRIRLIHGRAIGILSRVACATALARHQLFEIMRE